MTDLHFQRRNLEISYDTENDVLWMANDKQAPRGFDIVKNQVIAFFDYDGTTPTAIMIFDAAELLCPFFGPPEAKVSESSSVVHCRAGDGVAEGVIKEFQDPKSRKSDSLVVVQKDEQGDVEFQKFLMRDNLDIYYESEGDTLSLGNGRTAPYGGHDIAQGLIVFFESKGVPVHIEFFDAAEQIGGILAQARPPETAGLI